MNLLEIQKKSAKLPFSGNDPYLKRTSVEHQPAVLNTPEVTQEQADVRDKTEPSFSEITAAAFEENNLTTGVWNWLGEKHVMDLKYDKKASIAELTKGIPEEYLNEFKGYSREDDEQTLARVQRKIQDRATLAAGGMTALGMTATAMLLDPVGMGMFGAEGKLMAGVLTKGARAKNALYHMGSSMATGIAYEGSLHAVHGSEMDAEDVLYTAAGFGIGGGVIGAFSKGNAVMHKELSTAARGVQADLDAALVRDAVHAPMTYEEALVRAGDELPAPDLPEFPRMNKQQQAQFHAKHTPVVEARAQEILKQNAELLAKPKPVVPELNLDAPDETLGMFATARKNIQESWDRVAKNDGSTSGMFLPFEGAADKQAGQFTDLTDKMAKIEISDRSSQLVPNYLTKLKVSGFGTKENPLRQTADLKSMFFHPVLYNDFPKAAQLEVSFTKTGANAATYYPALDLIEISAEHMNNPAKIRELLIHEIQHAVQEKSGFAVGGNAAKLGTKDYLRLAGEEEARRTAKRANLVDDARIGDPYLGSDVAKDDLLVHMSSSDNVNGKSMHAFEPTADGGINRVATEGATPENILAENAVREGASASLKYTEHARQLKVAGVFDGLKTAIGKLQTKLGKYSATDSSFMLGMKADEAKAFMYDIMENGTGVMPVNGSAALKKTAIESRLLSEAMPEVKSFVQAWRARNNIPRWNPGTQWVDDMYKELRVEMELRTNAHYAGKPHVSPHADEVIKMADALDRANALALDTMVKNGVHMSESIVKRPGYVTLLWNGRVMRDAHKIMGLPEAYQKALAESYVSVTGMPIKDANKVSKAVMLRAKNNDLGIDSNPHALLSRDSREFLRDTLRNSGEMTEDEISGLLGRIDATMQDSGASARVKRRTNVDLLKTFEHNGKQYSLLDLVDNDMPMMHSRYIGEVSGRSALAAKGIASEADWTALRTAVLEGAGRAGDLPGDIEHMKTVIAGTYDQLLSRPAMGGVHRGARRLMDGAGVSLLAQAGMPQIAEFSQILGAHGVRNMWEVLDTVSAFRKSIKNGTVGTDLLTDMQAWTGRIWDEHMLYPRNVRLDDKLGNDAAWIRRLDRLTASAQELSGWMSGMYSIKRYQQQMTVALQANKMAKYLKGITFTESGYKATGEFAGQEARLAGVGWDTAFFKRMKEVEKHFEWDGNTLQRMNMQQWNDPLLINQFVEGIHKHTAQIIQKPHVGETHIWMHHTLGAMMTQFRNYPLVGIEKQSMRQLHMRDAESYFTAMYGLGMSSLVYSAKAALNAQGKSDADRKKYLDKRLSTAGMFKGALAYSSITSVLQDSINVAGAFGLAPEAMISTQTSRYGGSRGVDLSFKDIPSLGFATNGLNAVGGVVKNVVDPSYKYSKKDTQAIRGVIPLSTAHGITQFLNVMDEGVRED